MSEDANAETIQNRQRVSEPTSKAWTWIGYAFTWLMVMAVWQKGLSGYLSAFLVLYALGAFLAAAFFATRFAARYAAPLTSVAFLALWWTVGGTYSWRRDLIVTVLVTAAVLVSFPESRLWTRRLPARLRARRRLQRWIRIRENDPVAIARRAEQVRALKVGLVNFGKRTWTNARASSSGSPAVAHPVPPIQRRLSPTMVATAAFAIWFALSGLDYLLEVKPLVKDGSVVRPPAMPTAYEHLRVGLAMSGGGYRAALVHAGVVDALGKLGVPVTNMSSVSGGSIIASYLSRGGAPAAFRDAVADGRFRMTRDLLAFENLIRLPSPARAPGINVDLWPFFDHFSRLDVQANLVNRVLLADGKLKSTTMNNGPALMICMTDLTYGLSVGAIDEGYFLVGATSKRYFNSPEAIEFPALERLADRVAVSGAFPGAFPALQVRARVTTVSEPIEKSNHVSNLSLLLVDGGVRDNLGLSLLEAANAMAREQPKPGLPASWTGFMPPSEWALDLMLVSDGGKFMQVQTSQGVLETMMRAIDLSGLETGVLRPMRNTADHPVVVLSALSTVAPGPDAAIMGMPQTTMRDAHYQFFRPATLPADVLDMIVALVPDKVTAAAALKAYRAMPSDPLVSLDGLDQRCNPGNPGVGHSLECAWWSLVSLVGDDIWNATQVFAQTPTLSDTFSVDQANAVFRFGQYITFLKAPEIREALQTAQRTRAAASDSAKR